MAKTIEHVVVRDAEVTEASRLTSKLVVEGERLTHRLNAHLDDIQCMLDERSLRG